MSTACRNCLSNITFLLFDSKEKSSPTKCLLFKSKVYGVFIDKLQMEVIGTVYCYKGRTNPILAPNSSRATIYTIQNYFKQQIWDQHVTGSKFESLNFANFIWTFDIRLITFHLSIIQSQINLVKLANSFQVLFVNKANLSLVTGNVNYKEITNGRLVWSFIFIFHFKVHKLCYMSMSM